MLLQLQFAERAQLERGLADEGQGRLEFRAAVRGELRAIERRLRRGDGGVRIAHVGVGDEAALEDQLRLHAEERGLPQDEVGELARLDRADFVRDAVGDGGIDRVFGDVAQGAEIIRRGVSGSARRCVRRRACRTGPSSCARSARCG